METVPLTVSQVQTLRSCDRQYYIRYGLGIRKDFEEEYRSIGTVIHEANNYHAQGASSYEAMSRAIAQSTLDDDTKAWVATLSLAYFWRWEADQFEVLASELHFKIPLVNTETGRTSRTYHLEGVIDKIVRLPDSRIAVLETKTTGQALGTESPYWQRLRIDLQISIYYMSAQTLGYDIDTIIYDVIRKPTIKPKSIPLLDPDGFKIVLDAAGERVMLKPDKPRQSADKEKGQTLQNRLETSEEYNERLRLDIGERPDFYFARMEIPRTPTALEDAAYSMWAASQNLIQNQRHHRWPANDRACYTFSACDYFAACTSGHEWDNAPCPTGYHINPDTNPELPKGTPTL